MVALFDKKDEDVPFPDEKKDAGKTVVGRRPRQAREKKQEEPVVSASVAKKSVCSLFNMASRFVRSDARFKPDDFDAMVEGLRNIAEHVPIVRLILKWGSAFSILDTLYEKIEAIRAGRLARQQREASSTAQTVIDADYQSTVIP